MRSRVNSPDIDEQTVIISSEEYIENHAINAKNLKSSFLNEQRDKKYKAEIDYYIAQLSDSIKNCIDTNRNEPEPDKTSFCSSEIPDISVRRYLQRATYYLDATVPELITVLIYLSRYESASPEHLITEFNIHRLLLTAFMLAQKFHSDHPYKNYQVADVGGIEVEELNALEIEFLSAVNFALYISQEEYNDWKENIDDSPGHEDTLKISTTPDQPSVACHLSFFSQKKQVTTPSPECNEEDVVEKKSLP